MVPRFAPSDVVHPEAAHRDVVVPRSPPSNVVHPVAAHRDVVVPHSPPSEVVYPVVVVLVVVTVIRVLAAQGMSLLLRQFPNLAD